ncbi:hypothetical protein FGO68_gene14160 [Halteria grandinella]|uniref:Uncharacterized protein n=1 Tax=Halteria grandinella TaxID=5974 RepID=A0A8J8NT69_HALGN|nr:hypothetical protein FGO68_gene14160 [Halteria grandinella]
MEGRFNFGNIKSKYIIAQILSYGEQKRTLLILLYFTSARVRHYLIANYHLIQRVSSEIETLQIKSYQQLMRLAYGQDERPQNYKRAALDESYGIGNYLNLKKIADLKVENLTLALGKIVKGGHSVEQTIDLLQSNFKELETLKITDMKECFLHEILFCLFKSEVRHLKIESQWMSKKGAIGERWTVESLTIEFTGNKMKTNDLITIKTCISINQALIFKNFAIQDLIEILYPIEFALQTKLAFWCNSNPLAMGDLNTLQSYVNKKGPIKVVTPFISIPHQVNSLGMAKKIVKFYRKTSDYLMQYDRKQLWCESVTPDVVDYLIGLRDYLAATFIVVEGQKCQTLILKNTLCLRVNIELRSNQNNHLVYQLLQSFTVVKELEILDQTIDSPVKVQQLGQFQTSSVYSIKVTNMTNFNNTIFQQILSQPALSHLKTLTFHNCLNSSVVKELIDHLSSNTIYPQLENLRISLDPVTSSQGLFFLMDDYKSFQPTTPFLPYTNFPKLKDLVLHLPSFDLSRCLPSVLKAFQNWVESTSLKYLELLPIIQLQISFNGGKRIQSQINQGKQKLQNELEKMFAGRDTSVLVNQYVPQ